jgi:dihydroneopterin aldolase
MSDRILLEGIHGYGYHGLFEHERTNGQDFFVDLELDVDLLVASKSDEISDTVNYAEITDLVVVEITSDPVSLIEKLAGRIAERILNNYLKVNSVRVTVHKPQAPVTATLKDIAVQITRTR